MVRTNYIKNAELLIEINKSKMSYSVCLDPKYSKFDLVVDDLTKITRDFAATAIPKKAKLLGVSPDSINLNTIVFRFMTDDHLPIDPTKKRKPRPGELRNNIFHPFKHFILNDDDTLTEVARSHWKGDFETGEFSIAKGKMSDRLAIMIMLLVERYSHRSNWRGYTYVDEMRGSALVHLSQVALLFNEAKSDNPFAFYTKVIENCFRRVLIIEKKVQNTRDDILIANGAAPSYTRQIEHELQGMFEPQAELPKKIRGKKKVEVKVDI